MAILLNDLLQLTQDEIGNTKIKFNVNNGEVEPIDIYKDNRNELLKWQFWNSSKRSYYQGQIAVGFVKIDHHRWLLFDISRITKDLDLLNQIGYEYEPIKRFNKFIGRVVVVFESNSRQVIRKAESVIDQCQVIQVLEDRFDNDLFPGYENVRLSWKEMERVLKKNIWQTALGNQKGVYLITDRSSSKMYVGSAYGENMILGRWQQYIKSGHGGNILLKNIDKSIITEYFHYSILDIYKSTVEDKLIIQRENWWKTTLMTRTYGYNEN